MFHLFQTVTDLTSGRETLIDRSYGVIVVENESLRAVHLRPFPKIISQLEIWWSGGLKRRLNTGNICRLYYNQPLLCPGFLTLQYVESTNGATLATFRTALQVLDEIALLKQVGAVLCEVSNLRISHRLMTRWGWERHCLESPHRHYIKRLYDRYQTPADRLDDAIERYESRQKNLRSTVRS